MNGLFFQRVKWRTVCKSHVNWQAVNCHGNPGPDRKMAYYCNLVGLDVVLTFGVTYLTDYWETELRIGMFKSCLNGGHEVSLSSVCRMTAALLPSLLWGVFVFAFTMWYAFRSISGFPWILLLDLGHQETFRAFLCFSDSRGLMGNLICLHNGRLYSNEELADRQWKCRTFASMTVSI